MSLGATGPRIDRYDRAEPIVFASQHHLELLPLQLGTGQFECFFSLVGSLGIVAALFLCHREKELASSSVLFSRS